MVSREQCGRSPLRGIAGIRPVIFPGRVIETACRIRTRNLTVCVANGLESERGKSTALATHLIRLKPPPDNQNVRYFAVSDLLQIQSRPVPREQPDDRSRYGARSIFMDHS